MSEIIAHDNPYQPSREVASGAVTAVPRNEGIRAVASRGACYGAVAGLAVGGMTAIVVGAILDWNGQDAIARMMMLAALFVGLPVCLGAFAGGLLTFCAKGLSDILRHYISR